MPLRELADVAAQSGINFLKFPLWQSVILKQPNDPVEIGAMLELLALRRITPVGLLNHPPPKLRSKFGADFPGVSKIFTLPPKFWWESVEPVIARYTSSIRHWQLGGEDDGSFVELNQLPGLIKNVKTKFDTIGRDTRIGFRWNWKTPFPSRASLPFSYFSLDSKKKRLTGLELQAALRARRASGVPRWVQIRPLPKSGHTSEERGRDLVKRMVHAKVGGAEAIIADGVFHPEHGLLKQNGSPSRLYLPWRTTALALQGREYLGSVNFPNGSTNHVFVQDGEAVIVLWSEKPKTEEFYLGENVEVLTIWGKKTQPVVKPGTNRTVLQIGPTPIIVRGCSEPVARWRVETTFEVPQLQSRSGGQAQAVLTHNTFKDQINGKMTVHVPEGWTIQGEFLKKYRALSGDPIKQPMKITVPAKASLGDVRVRIEFEINADRRYNFQVFRTIQVGLGDVSMQVFDRRLDDGRLEIEQVIINNITPGELLSFRCNLFIPNQQRQRRLVTKFARGKDRRFYYLPNADALRGTTLRLRAEEIDGNRRLNFRWKVLGKNTRKKLKPTKKGYPKSPSGTPKQEAANTPSP